jgi:hypothetical protein
MATQYYFLISSLPLLRFGAAPFLSSSRFLDLVTEQAGQELADKLATISLAPKEPGRFAAERFWYTMETHIRNYLLRARSRKATQVDRWRRPEKDVFPSLDHQLHKALGAPNPLERERQLDAIRWELLDEPLIGENFSVDALVVYRLRLLIAEKWQAFSSDKGREALDALVGKAREEARRVRTLVEP